MAIKLTNEQKDFLRENFEKYPDLAVLTQKCFEKESIDGRSKEGRLVSAFLRNEGLNYKTSKHEKVEDVILTQEQKDFILIQMQENSGLSSFAIAKLIFGDKDGLTALSKEVKTVFSFMKENDPDHSENGDVSGRYSAPQAMSRIIKKVQDATGIEIDEKRMSRNIAQCLEKLKINLNNKRFVIVMSNINNSSDRDLLESEFIRHTWDKSDLTPDEVSLYINLAKEILVLETCTKHIEKLKYEFDASTGGEGDKKLTVTLSEIIKTKTDEYHKSSQRIESLIKKLQGDRAKRIESAHQSNASILSLVHAFQEEDERSVMIDIANKQREAVESEVNRLESMDSLMCRILGIGKEDVL